jgi:hypothetical protein
VDPLTLDTLDEQLIHALQVDGRASFNQIAAVLGASDRTVARRYHRPRHEPDHPTGKVHATVNTLTSAAANTRFRERIVSEAERCFLVSPPPPHFIV